MGGLRKANNSGAGTGALFPGWVVFMRDVLAVAGVIVLALCLGVASAYLSVDLTPPGLELIRPLKPAVAARIERENKQSTLQAEASACKYCTAVAELAQTFARYAKSARQQATALQTTIGLDKRELTREVELRTAEKSADSAESAAAALTSWASRCKAEDFCRAPVKRVSGSACASGASDSVTSALLLASAIRKSAKVCADSACPSVDCNATAGLKADVLLVERSLAGAGGRFSPSAAAPSAARLAVGASSFQAELKRVREEAIYVTKMLPLMLGNASNGHLPKLASEMVEERAVSAAQLAADMEHSAAVADGKNDPRYEAAWRLKAFAANLAILGHETRPQDGTPIDWQKAGDALGAALFDLARLQAILDRVSDITPGAEGCVASAPAAAQQLREAVAMLDLCRMRSACSSRSGFTLGTQVRAENAAGVIARAQTKAEQLIVQEMGSAEMVAVPVSDRVLRPIDVLRSQQGVCIRAMELREASKAAPGAALSVVQAAAPSLQPAVGAVAPQDIVSGAVDAAVNGAATARDSEMVVETSAPGTRAASSGGSEVIPAAAPAASAPPGPPAFTGNLLTQSGPAFVAGEGGPIEAGPPASPPVKQP